MAIIRAAVSGNFSAPGTWIGGVVPGAADDAVSNGFIVVVDTNITVLSLSNSTTGGATLGGAFNFTVGGVTANIGALTAGTGGLIIFNYSTGTTTVNVTNSFFPSVNAIQFIGGGTVNFNIPLIFPATSIVNGAFLKNGAGTLNFVGNLTAAGAGNNGVMNITAGTVNITGNVQGGASAQASTGLNITGGTTTVTGSVTGGSSTGAAHGIVITSGNLVVIGNVTGGGGTLAQGIGSTTTGAITVTGIISANAQVGLSSTQLAATVQVSGPLVNVNGISAISAVKFFITGTSTFWTNQSSVGVNRILYTNDQVTGFPSVANVRLGTVYGVSGGLTGTLIVPSPSNVLQGVGTDATVGTLLMTPADFWNYLISSGFTANSIGDRLQNASTVATTGGQIASYNI
jgi:hypothetical protein